MERTKEVKEFADYVESQLGDIDWGKKENLEVLDDAVWCLYKISKSEDIEIWEKDGEVLLINEGDIVWRKYEYFDEFWEDFKEDLEEQLEWEKDHPDCYYAV